MRPRPGGSAAPLAALALFLLAAFPGSAAATVRSNPVKLRAAGPAPVLREGEAATLRFEFASREDVAVSNVSVESSSLAQPFARRATPMRATPTEPAALEVAILPAARPEPLVVRWEVAGVPYERTVDLASRMEDAIAERSALEQVSTAGAKPPTAAMLASADSLRRAREAAGAGTDGTLIFFSGRLVYTRPGSGTVPTQDVGAMGVRVSLMDEDTGFDDELAATYTDADGDFYYWTYWDGQLLEGDPELYIKFETDHPWVVVQEGFWDIEYSWNTSVRGSSTADLHLGTFRPGWQPGHPPLHIATNIVKNHIWYEEQAGYFLDGVDVKWPDGDNAYFDPLWEQIHISHAREWNEATHAHEYGHFFVHSYGRQYSPSYCNGYCDTPDCGHCHWCEEGRNEAYSEGWPNWVSAVQTRSYKDRFGLDAIHHYDFEKIAKCGAAYAFTDPAKTEGIFAGVLWDLYDGGTGADDTDPDGYGWRDRMALGIDEIFHTLDVGEPTNSYEFLANFAAFYPQHRASVWEVAMNNRWDIDVFAPGPVTNLASASHPVGVATAKLNVSLSWTPPGPDDWSGIKGYSIAIGATPQAPDAILEAGVTSSWTSGDLAPGTYYVTVRAVDRANRVSDTYPVYGPFTIVQPTPVDIAPYTAPGWARPLVARATGDATSGSVPNPVGQLPGNTAPTYFNVSGRNQGQSDHVGFIGIRTRLFADAVGFHTSGYVHPDAAGATFQHLNRAGTIRGGRHMIGAILDGFNEWWESNEVNNYWSHAWVWSPLALTANAAVRRQQPPPNPTGSWSGVFDGSPTYYNCDGFRIAASGWWNAVWVAADADSDDYDVRLHPASSSPDAGFDTVWGWGSEPEGALDVVLANRNTMGSTNLDIGVINDLDAGQDFVAQSPFVVKHVTSGSFPFADTAAVAFPDSEMVVLKEVYVPAAGPVTVTLWADTLGGAVRVAWLDRLFTAGALAGGPWAERGGRTSFDVTAGGAGYHCVALWRDPRDGRGARACTLGVEATPADLVPIARAGWHGPVVPRPAPDGNAATVSAPDTLHGGVAGTYVNFAWKNDSPGAAVAAFSARVRVDGEPLASAGLPGLAAFEEAVLVGASSPPFTLRGGRHMLSVSYDDEGLVREKSDANNAWGEQWVWSPLPLTPGVALTEPAPPDPVGGFEHWSGTGPLHSNSAGYRATFAAGTGMWGSVGVIPADSSDADLRLHEPASGALEGFGEALGISSWGPGDSDFLLVRHDGARTVDAGVTRGDEGAGGPFDIVADGAAPLAAIPLATGDQPMATGAIVRLHPVVLPAGVVRLRLVPVAGAVDWGVSLHDDSTGVRGKDDALGAAWLAGPGGAEEVVVPVAAADTFVVAVWKRGSADRGAAGTYRLQVDADVLDAPPGDLPRVTALAPARPSPFRDCTALAFDLARAGEVKLEIFDLRGARVRTLVKGVLGAGRHSREWRGESDGGAAAPPGLYLVRLESGGARSQQKIVRLD